MIGQGIGKGVSKPSYAQRPGFFAGILGMLAGISGTLLTMGFVGTEEAIKLRLQEDLQRSLAQVLPPEKLDNDPSVDQVTLDAAPASHKEPTIAYIGRWEELPVAAAFEVTEPGYSGVIRVVMGVANNGEILGVRVLAHTETPGLGDKIEIAKDDWILSFNGLSLDNLPDKQWAVKKDGGQFDQFSGATITPRAVVKAVKKGLLMQRDQQQLLTTAPLPTSVEPLPEQAPAVQSPQSQPQTEEKSS